MPKSHSVALLKLSRNGVLPGGRLHFPGWRHRIWSPEQVWNNTVADNVKAIERVSQQIWLKTKSIIKLFLLLICTVVWLKTVLINNYHCSKLSLKGFWCHTCLNNLLWGIITSFLLITPTLLLFLILVLNLGNSRNISLVLIHRVELIPLEWEKDTWIALVTTSRTQLGNKSRHNRSSSFFSPAVFEYLSAP